MAPKATSTLRARFIRHRWPGNVRELRNSVERAYILCDGELSLSDQDMLTLRRHPEGEGTSSDMIQMPIGATLEEVERTFNLATLKHFEGDKRRAADVLGCSLKTLYNKLHAYQRDRGAGMNETKENAMGFILWLVIGGAWLACQHRDENRWKSGPISWSESSAHFRQLADQPDGGRGHDQFRGHQPGRLLVSFLGAVVLLAIVNLITRKRVR
jgi:hypothetical protein